MLTTFQKVSMLNMAFGNPKGNILEPNWGKIQSQSNLVMEEAIELLEAAYPGKKVSVKVEIEDLEPGVKSDEVDHLRRLLDAQGDITTVNDGVAHIAGFNGDQVLGRVDTSNRSKFITTDAEIGPALKYYYDLGFAADQLEIQGEYPAKCIKVAVEVTVAGKFYPKGKFLKNMAKFKEPEFEDILAGQAPQLVNQIIGAAGVEPGHMVNVGNGVVLINNHEMSGLATNIKQGKQTQANDGQVESYSPLFEYTPETHPQTPELWGWWEGNCRIFTVCPDNYCITALTRID